MAYRTGRRRRTPGRSTRPWDREFLGKLERFDKDALLCLYQRGNLPRCRAGRIRNSYLSSLRPPQPAGPATVQFYTAELPIFRRGLYRREIFDSVAGGRCSALTRAVLAVLCAASALAALPISSVSTPTPIKLAPQLMQSALTWLSIKTQQPGGLRGVTNRFDCPSADRFANDIRVVATLPPWPIDADRSDGPINTPSTPSTAAIAARLSIAVVVSACTMTQISSLALAAYSRRSAFQRAARAMDVPMSAPAGRRVLHCGNDGLGLLRCVDHRYQEALHADIAKALQNGGIIVERTARSGPRRKVPGPATHAGCREYSYGPCSWSISSQSNPAPAIISVIDTSGMPSHRPNCVSPDCQVRALNRLRGSLLIRSRPRCYRVARSRRQSCRRRVTTTGRVNDPARITCPGLEARRRGERIALADPPYPVSRVPHDTAGEPCLLNVRR